MEIIADVGGTRGRWVIVDKTIIKTIETSGFNPYSYNISSLDRNHNMFDPINYWRGPMWTNLSWLIISGLYKVNEIELANKIRLNCIKKIEEIGFYEYFNSNDTENKKSSGCGDNCFSWTAAMYICLTSNIKM